MADVDDEMSGDLAFFLVILILVSIPVTFLLTIQTCIAYGRTRQWKKEKQSRHTLPQSDAEAESQALNNKDDEGSDSDLDDLGSLADSEDEADRESREQEKADANDWHLTTGQKFAKEWKKAWKGRGPAYMERERKRAEREESRKMAKRVAKEMLIMQRKKERKAARIAELGESSTSRNVGEDYELPTYNTAMAQEKV